MITHIIFDLHRTLIDPARLVECMPLAIGRIMAGRYGATADLWADAYQRIVTDWDSYYADLDLNGDEGLAHVYEGMFRTTRALFRLANVGEPHHDDLTALSRELPILAMRGIHARYPDADETIRALHDGGFTLGIATSMLTAQAQALLGDLAGCFTRFTGVDTTGYIAKDVHFLRHALHDIPPENALLVDDSVSAILTANSLGMPTAHVFRNEPPRTSPATWTLHDDLRPLVGLLQDSHPQI